MPRSSSGLSWSIRDGSFVSARSAWIDAKAFLRALPAYLEPAVRREAARDRAGLAETDPGARRVVDEGTAWLCRAQDLSASADGGFARHYGLVDGWAPSYPETTGYVVPTLLAGAGPDGDEGLLRRARRALDWLLTIQMDCGAFQGGVIGSPSNRPVVFNTGQILLGLAAGVRRFGPAAPYGSALERAAGWLARVQARDGSWPRNESAHAPPGPKTYHTHVAWGLLEAARVAENPRWAEAALANVRWAVGNQSASGWLDRCSLGDPERPLTHALGYALRGFLEAWRYSGDAALLAAARRTADGLLKALGPDGFLPGRLHGDWRRASRWACLTGTSQIAHCWLQLHEDTGDPRYGEAALVANRYVRRTVRLDGSPELRGAVRGSFPVSGGYCRFQFPNWACKFTVDANRLELELRR